MITMMVLLCYVNLSGMSLESMVIVLMNNLLLGGQFCTIVDNLLQPGLERAGWNRVIITPRFNFTCDGRITSIRLRVFFEEERSNYLRFQVWRQVSSIIYKKIGEVQLQPDDQFDGIYGVTGQVGIHRQRIANIKLTSNNTIEFQSGDVVGYYHPPDPRYSIVTAQLDGYVWYEFGGTPQQYLNFHYLLADGDRRLPLIQVTIGKCAFQSSSYSGYVH